MLDEATPTWRIDAKEQKKLLAVIINKDRRTWSQLTNYYGSNPKELMSRIRSLNDKLTEGQDYANDHDDVSKESVSESEWDTYILATQYRFVMETAFGGIYNDLVIEYQDIYGDD